jgi:hypothetical protein
MNLRSEMWRQAIVMARKEITRESTGGLSKPKRKKLICRRAKEIYDQARKSPLGWLSLKFGMNP